MMNESENLKEQKVVELLSLLLNINSDDVRQKLLLIRAIKYANIDTYTVSPKNSVENILNEIFLTRAENWWRRKIINIHDDEGRKKYYNIEKYEHYKVS